MVASKARKERRQHFVDPKVVETEAPLRKKTKFGRKEKRTITRHTRRSRPDQQVEPQEAEAFEASEEENVVSDDSDLEHSTVGSNRKAYESLVTLLKHEHDVPARASTALEQKAAFLQEEVEKNDGNEEEVAGVAEGDDIDESSSDEEEIFDEGDEEEDEAISDPFNSHFNDDEDAIDTKINKYKNLIIEIKKGTAQRRTALVNKVSMSDYTILENLPNIGGEPLSSPGFNPHSFHIKQKLVPLLESKDLSPVQKYFCNSMFQYQNINLQYYDDDKLENSYQELYLLHCLNHILKTRDRVLKNNSKKATILENIQNGTMKPEEEPEFRDQGYSRPKVLILLPTRNFAYELVMKLIELASMESVENKSKFTKQFFDDFEFDAKSKKSIQFKKFFKGNTNDFFCLGLKFTRKTLKLYSSFDTSDVIIASPIGLKMLFERKPTAKSKKLHSSNDFLSSIEIFIIDKSHGLLMQNWDHVSSIVANLNLPPKTFSENVDFSRVRMWSINDNAKYLTQFLNFTRFTTPELNNMINAKSLNLRGALTIKPVINDSNSVINTINKTLNLKGILSNETKLKQIFQRFDAESIAAEPDARFKYFINVTLSQILNKLSYKNGVLIYVPSYLDYISLTVYFKSNSKFEVLAIDEYSSQSKLTKSRLLFDQQPDKYKIMLYTERLHFYKNYELKGVKNLIFYSAPTDPQFYQDCINFLIRTKLKSDLIANGIIETNRDSDAENFDLNLSSVRVLFSKFDVLKLEKLVGSSKAGLLCNGSNEMFEFR